MNARVTTAKVDIVKLTKNENILNTDRIGPLKEVHDDQERRRSGMADRPKRKVEFIESYWTGGELGSDYQWSDNHGELIRCRDCKNWVGNGTDPSELPYLLPCKGVTRPPDYFCADGEMR